MVEFLLQPWQAVLLLLLSVLIIRTGRIGWAVGIYTALPSLLIIFRFGPLSHLYVYLATMAGTAMVYRLRHRGSLWLPRHDRWIVLWMGMWTIWILLIIFMNGGDPSTNRGLIQSLLQYLLVPLPFFLLIAADTAAMRDFALSYVAVITVGSLVILSRLPSTLGIPVSYLLSDPFLTRFEGGGQFFFAHAAGISNYHWLAYGLGISLVFILTLSMLARRTIDLLVLGLCAAFQGYLLLMMSSRQSTVGAIIVAGIYVYWLRSRIRLAGRLSIVVIALLFVSSVAALLVAHPEVLLRGQVSLVDSLNPLLARQEVWTTGWQAFLASPLWGDWFAGSASLGHNYFISTLANQGLVGASYLAIFLVFIARQLRGMLTWCVNDEANVWRIAFLCMGLFSFLVAQVSGSPVSNWPIAWAAVVLWRMKDQEMLAHSPARQDMHMPPIRQR